MRRHLIGILALLSLAGAAAFEIWPDKAEQAPLTHAGLVRGGILAALVWLAYPDVRRLPGWLWGTLLGILAVVVIRPRVVFLAVPLIIALAILRPRLGRRG